VCLTIREGKRGVGNFILYWSNKTYFNSKNLKAFEATRSDNIFGAQDVTLKRRHKYAYAIPIDVANRPKDVTIKININLMCG